MQINCKNVSRRTILYAALVILIILLSSGTGYYFYWQKTPQHSVELIADAVEEHDMDAFNKHVDLDSLLDSAYDDYFSSYFANDAFMQKNPLKNLSAGLVKMAKTAAVSELKSEINGYVQTGIWNDTAEENNNTDSKTPKTDGKSTISEKLGVKDTHFKNIEYTKIDGDTAEVGIKITESGTKKDFVIEIAMTKLADGTWKAVKINNMKDYAADLIEFNNSNNK